MASLFRANTRSRYLESALAQYGTAPLPIAEARFGVHPIPLPLKRRAQADEADWAPVSTMDVGEPVVANGLAEALALSPQRRVAILGGAGAGKSTALWQLFFEAAKRAQHDSHAPLPVWISLPAVARAGVSLQAFLDGQAAPAIQSAVAKGQGMFCLDGLEALATLDRQRLLPEIGSLATQWGGSWVVTADAHDYQAEALGAIGFAAWELQPLAPNECAALAQAQLAAMARMPHAHMDPSRTAPEFLQRLADHPCEAWRLKPLLVALAAIAYTRTGKIPLTQTELAEHALATALSAIDPESRQLGQLRGAICELSFHLLSYAASAFTLEDVAARARELDWEDAQATTVVDRMVDCGFVDRVTSDIFEFRQPLLLGYLAAQALAARCGGDDPFVREQAWELAWSRRLARHWTHTLQFLPGIMARAHGVTGARVALRWLLALRSQRCAPDGDPAYRSLALAMVTLPEVADVASFWGDNSSAGLVSQITATWAEALLDVALHGQESQLAILAPTVATMPERVTAPALERLLAALHDEDWQARAAAVRALAALGSRAPLDALTESLTDPEWRVRKVAIESLSLFAAHVQPEALLPLLGDRWVSLAAARALAALGERAPTQALLAALRDRDPFTRSAAAAALGLLGASEAIDALLAALGDEDDMARAAAAEALGRPSMRVASMDRLVALLRNRATALRARVAAAAALGLIGGQKPVERLTDALKDREWPVRAAAAAALRAAGAQLPTKSLLAALKDREWPVRLSSVQTLAALGARLPVEPVFGLLRDQEPRVRAAAALALGLTGATAAFDALLTTLRDEDEDVRAAAAQALGHFGERSVESLLAARDDPSPVARQSIVQALGVVGGQAALDPLVTTLHASDEDMRLAAVQALGALSRHTPPEDMLSALRKVDSWPETRAAAAQALGALGEQAPVARLVRLLSTHEDWQVRVAAVRALGAPDVPTPISPLVAALRDTSAAVRIIAVETLGAQGVRAPVQSLMQALRDRNPSVRAAAAYALGPLGAWTPVEALVEALQDHDWQARAIAVERLGALGTQAPTDVLVEALADEAWQVRLAAVEALAQQGSLGPAGPIAAMLNDPDTVVRARAARALGSLGSSAPMSALRAAMSDNDARVRVAAAYALGQLGQKELLETLAEDPDAGVRRAAGRALGGESDEDEAGSSNRPVARAGSMVGGKAFGGQSLVAALVDLLGDRDPGARIATVAALGMLGDQAPVDVLVGVVQDSASDPMDQARVEAVRSLGSLGERAPVTVLVEATRDPAWPVRRAALDALRALGPRAPLAPLVAALRDPDADVRASAVRALGGQDDRAPVADLIAALGDSEWRVRAAAAEALEVLGAPEAIEPLLAMLKDERNDPFGHASAAATRALGTLDAWDVVESLLDMQGERAWRVRAAAVEVLAWRGDEAPVARILDALNDPSWMVRASAAGALGTLGDETPLGALVAALDDPVVEVRVAAVRSLGLQGQNAPLGPLLGALGDEHASVRIAGLEALSLLGHRVPPARLVALLGDSDAHVRRVAARVVRRAQPEALQALEPEAAAIIDRQHSGRVLGSLTQGFLAETLGQLGRAPDQMLASLIELLDWPYWEVRMKAIHALRKLRAELPDPAVRRLVELCRDPESRAVRQAAEEALANLLTLEGGLEE